MNKIVSYHNLYLKAICDIIRKIKSKERDLLEHIGDKVKQNEKLQCLVDRAASGRRKRFETEWV